MRTTKKFLRTKWFATMLVGALLTNSLPTSVATAEGWLVGDINGDTVISISDVVLFSQCVSQTRSVSDLDRPGVNWMDLDFNRDNSLDVGDLNRMSQYLCNIISYEQMIGDGSISLEDESLVFLKEAAAAMPSYPEPVQSSENRHGIKQKEIEPGLAAFSANTIPTLMSKSLTDNKCYSPLSYYMALSDLSETVQGNGQAQILSALGVKDIETLREYNTDFFKDLYFENTSAKCILANSLWLRDSYMGQKVNYRQDTLDILAKHYFAQSYVRDFDDPATGEIANEWLNYYTGGKIPGAKLDFSGANSLAIIVNTINFEDKWDSEFFELDEKKPFTLADGVSMVDATYLGETRDDTYVQQTEQYTKARVGTQNGFEMYLVEPAEGTTAQEILADKNTVNEMLSTPIHGNYEDLTHCSLDLQVPQFSYSDDLKLLNMTESLGITDVLSGAADFSPLTEDFPLCVSDVYQKSHIEIDKQGCSAAALTVIVLNEATLLLEEPPRVEMHLDRPFIYYIAANDGTPLFVGLINNPNLDEPSESQGS